MSGHDNITVELPPEALLDDDFELWLAWAPLAETGESCSNEACDDGCTCEEDDSGA
jgi:hypothetical protein